MIFITIEIVSKSLNITKRSAERKAVREDWVYTEESRRGGSKRLYRLADLPADVQTKVTLHLIQTGQLQPEAQAQPADSKEKPVKRSVTNYDPDSLWSWFDTRNQKIKAEATKRAAVCLQVRRLIDASTKVRPAIRTVAEAEYVSEKTLLRWWYGDSTILGAANVHPSDYAPALAPRYTGGQESAEISPDAWEYIKADWLRPEKPTVAAVYRRAKSIASEKGWVLPSKATIERRLNAISWKVRVLARDGEDALKRALPHVTRSKAHMYALQAVNADGHIFDVRVQLPSGDVGRPALVAWQDIYSGKIIAWRLGETFNQHIVRLAFGDLVEEYGIPEHAFLDNGREFANKWLTGQMKHRFRFKIREDEPEGIFLQLGMQVHWTTPYHGQAKPIERAFRDLCEGIAKHPACSGAYTGNSPSNKPANYGERALEWDVFLAVVQEGIAEHNARQGRRTEVAKGRSFDEAFADSYGQSTIRKATAEQRRLWLLAGEGVKVLNGGHIQLQGNRYWADSLGPYQGKAVTVRFDPEDLTKPVHVYSLAGEYLGEAETRQVSFIDAQAAKEHNRQRRAQMRATKQALEAQRKMDAIEAAQMLPNVVTPMKKVKPGAIAPMFERAAKVANGPDEERPDEALMLSWMNHLPRRTEED